jgi:signal transduction histidine kinase
VWTLSGWGIRYRLALACVAVMAVVLAVAAFLFVWLHLRSEIDSADAAALTRAQAVAVQLAASEEPILDTGATATLVQVLTAQGQVLASSVDITGQPAISPLRPASGVIRREERHLPRYGDAPLRIVALRVHTPAGDRIILAGQSLHPAYESAEAEIRLLLVGYPLLLVATGVATAWFARGALRAVDLVRRRVAVITASRLDERVPVPPTGDELSRLAVTMNEMLDRVESSVLAQRRFVADASHELRSPLSTVRVSLELLRERIRAGIAVTDEAAVAGVLVEVGRVEHLLADLLLLAKADEQGIAGRREEVDLDDVVHAEVRRITRVTARIEPVRVLGDRGQLSRAVRNLLDNAGRYASGKVTVRLWSSGGRAWIEVADDGPGVPRKDFERVFARFVRLDDSRDRGSGGSGLGLAIVQEIVTGHGGQVRVDTGPDGGAVFRISLPLPVAVVDQSRSVSR